MTVEELLHRLVAADREHREAMKAAQAEGGALVKTARKILGLTQQELAEKLGVDNTYVSKIEKGRSAPSKPFLRHLAQVMAGEEVEDRATRESARTRHLTDSRVVGNDTDS